MLDFLNKILMRLIVKNQTLFRREMEVVATMLEGNAEPLISDLYHGMKFTRVQKDYYLSQDALIRVKTEKLGFKIEINSLGRLEPTEGSYGLTSDVAARLIHAVLWNIPGSSEYLHREIKEIVSPSP